MNPTNEHRRTRVLFNWMPRVLDRSLGERIRRRLSRAGIATLGSLIEVRDPEFNTTQSMLGWHRDMTGTHLPLIMWSNVRPTLVRFPDDSLLEARDGDVLLVYNEEVMHCAPDDQTGRWFIRTNAAEVL